MAVLCLNEKSGRSKPSKKVVSYHRTGKSGAKSRKTHENAGKLLASRSNLPASVLLRKAPDFSDKRMVSEVSSYIRRYVSEGWEASIISFMFKPLPDKRVSMLKLMNSEVELFYSKLITRVDRDPTAPSHFQWLPRLFVAPDLPVCKHIKDPRANVTINDGFHGQAICLIPPQSRLKDELCLHVKAKGVLSTGFALAQHSYHPHQKRSGVCNQVRDENGGAAVRLGKCHLAPQGDF